MGRSRHEEKAARQWGGRRGESQEEWWVLGTLVEVCVCNVVSRNLTTIPEALNLICITIQGEGNRKAKFIQIVCFILPSTCLDYWDCSGEVDVRRAIKGSKSL